METMAEFFNKIGRSLPSIDATRIVLIRCQVTEKLEMAWILALTPN
jgi:hypothetical protein